MKIALCGIFKNEAPYIVEWVAYHRLIGVNKFYIANNESTDQTKEILQGLKNNGLIDYFDYSAPAGEPPQLLAYQEIINNFSHEVDWMGFLDADEYVFPSELMNFDLSSYLRDVDFEGKIGAVVFNWSVIGSANKEFYEPKFLLERFKMEALKEFKENHHYKTFFKTKALKSVGGNPHYFNVVDGYSVVHADGSPVLTHDRGLGLSSNIVWSPVRINHYLLKSKEEFLKKKKNNGSAAVLGRKKGLDYFCHHDRNDQFFEVDEAFLSKLRNAVDSIYKIIGFDASQFSSFFDGKADFHSLTRDSGTLDYFGRNGKKFIFKGWAAVDLSLDDVKICLQFNEAVHFIDEFKILERRDVFDKGLSKSIKCGFLFEVEKNIFEAKGVPLRISFQSSNCFSKIEFRIVESQRDILFFALEKKKLEFNFLNNVKDNKSLYEVFDKSDFCELRSFDGIKKVENSFFCFSSPEITNLPQIKIINSAEVFKPTNPVFLPIAPGEFLPEVGFSPAAIVYHVNDCFVFPDGVIKKGGKFFIESFRNGSSRPHTGIEKWKGWSGEFNLVEEDAFYLGGEHFGAYSHFLSEIFSRLWISKYIDLNKFKILVDKKNIPHVKRLLELAKVPSENLYEMSGPVHVKSLIVSSQSHIVRTGLNKEGAEFYKRVSKSITNKVNCKNVYLSRRFQSQRRLLNEDKVEGVFRRLGFDVVFPELLTIDTQIAIFEGCENIAGISGSGFFTSLFGAECKRSFIITNSAYILHNDQVMNTYNKSDITYFIQKTDVSRGLHADWEIDLKALEKSVESWLSIN